MKGAVEREAERRQRMIDVRDAVDTITHIPFVPDLRAVTLMERRIIEWAISVIRP